MIVSKSDISIIKKKSLKIKLFELFSVQKFTLLPELDLIRGSSGLRKST